MCVYWGSNIAVSCTALEDTSAGYEPIMCCIDGLMAAANYATISNIGVEMKKILHVLESNVNFSKSRFQLCHPEKHRPRESPKSHPNFSTTY